MALGMTLEEVVAASTATPAGIFDFGETLGTLAPGAPADVSIFDMMDADQDFVDSSGGHRPGDRRLVPRITLRDGAPFGVSRG